MTKKDKLYKKLWEMIEPISKICIEQGWAYRFTISREKDFEEVVENDENIIWNS
jgi:hypothetical protein